MNILGNFLDTPGSGGLFVGIVIALLILIYSLAIRWIMKGGKTKKVKSQPVEVKSQEV